MRVAGYQSAYHVCCCVWDNAGLPIFNAFSECKDPVRSTGTVEVYAFPHYPQALQPALFDGQTLFLSLLQVAFVFFPKHVYGLLGFGS